MILSNNPRTYIDITIYHKYRGITYIDYIYTHRWTGPSAVHTSELRSALWNKDDIKNYKESL